MLYELLVPAAELQVEAACALARLADHERPGFGDLVVGVVLVSLVLVAIPVRQPVDHVGDGIEVGEGEHSLGLLRWQEVRGVVSQGVDQLQEMVADAVVGVVGGGAVAEREGFAEGALVCAEHLQSRFYRRARCLGDNLLL